MSINKLIKNLEERLETLKNEYDVYVRQSQFNKAKDSCYERNEVNRLLILLELKGQINELERVLAYMEMIKFNKNINTKI